MSSDGSTVRWNPHIEDEVKDEILEVDWREVPDEFINNNHSSESLKWDGENYFNKAKDRRPSKTIQELTRTGEFDHRLMLYDEHHDTGVHAPTPYGALLNEGDETDEVVMEFMGGNGWVSFPRAFSSGEIVDEDEVRQVCQGLGRFAKILQNEQMKHGDIALRHFYVDQDSYDVGVIDIENGTANARPSAVEEEIDQIEGVIDRIPRPQYEDQMFDWYNQGYESVPDPEDTQLPTSVYESEDDGYDLTDTICDTLGWS